MTLRENHQFDYSMAVLAAQERDRHAERTYSHQSRKVAALVCCLCVIGVIVLTVIAFVMNKEEFLLECVKYLAVGGGGGGLGYVFGYRKGSHK
jgi:hypothetical protein